MNAEQSFGENYRSKMEKTFAHVNVIALVRRNIFFKILLVRFVIKNSFQLTAIQIENIAVVPVLI